MKTKKTAAFRIFHSWWGFILPQYATISDYQASVVGLYLPNDKVNRNMILGEDTYCTMTIAQAVGLYEKGVRIKLNRPETGIEIYELIMEHLVDWLNFLKNGGLVVRPVPIDDLRLLARMAESLFPVAHRKGYFQQMKAEKKSMKMTLGAFFGEVAKEEDPVITYNNRIITQIESFHRAYVSETKR